MPTSRENVVTIMRGLAVDLMGDTPSLGKNSGSSSGHLSPKVEGFRCLLVEIPTLVNIVITGFD